MQAPIIDGAGALQARGGSGHTSYTYGGGGGMIALVASAAINGKLGDTGLAGDNQPWALAKVYGGWGVNGGAGGSGSFYRKVGDAAGDVMFDNNGQVTFTDNTPLVFQGSGGMSGLTATSLTGGSPFDSNGPITDYLINPKVGQGTASLGDDHVYRVTANSGATVNFVDEPDPTTFAAPGTDLWGAYYVFDNVEVRGNARVQGDVQLRVNQGDISSSDGVTLRLRGTLHVTTLDLNQSTDVELVTGASGELNVGTLVQGDRTDYPFVWRLNDGALTKAMVDGQSLTSGGATVNVGAMHLLGDATFAGASHVTFSNELLRVDGTLTVTDSGTWLTHTATGGGPERHLRIETDT
ncbi:MAG: hypothetical protein CVU56_29855, partial [Deltaproteobacteria bacterium HGW-Deltaproteobacteria-14]